METRISIRTHVQEIYPAESMEGSILECARELGMPYHTLRGVLYDRKRHLGLDKLRLLAGLLNVSVDNLTLLLLPREREAFIYGYGKGCRT